PVTTKRKTRIGRNSPEGKRVFERSFSTPTGRVTHSNQVNFDLVDGQRLISGAILCLLGMPSKGAVTCPASLSALVHPLQIHHLSRRQSVGFLLRYRFDCGSP